MRPPEWKTGWTYASDESEREAVCSSACKNWEYRCRWSGAFYNSGCFSDQICRVVAEMFFAVASIMEYIALSFNSEFSSKHIDKKFFDGPTIGCQYEKATACQREK